MRVSKTKLALALSAALLATSAMAEIKIAVLGPYSNSTSQDFGLGVKEGASLAAAEINANGGILNGQKITLVQYDDNSSPDKGVEAAKSAVNKDKVVAAVGLVNTGVVLKVAPVFQNAKIPFIITGSTGGQTGNMFINEPVNYVFRNTPPDSVQAAFLIKQVYDTMKHRKIAVFADSSPYGQSGVDFITKNLKERNAAPIIVERFPVGEVDMEQAAIRARDAGADSVIVWSLGPEAAAVKVSLNRIGWRVPYYGGWTLTSKVFTDNSGPIAANTKMVVTVTGDTLSDTTKKFMSNYRVLNNKSTIPSLMSAGQTYDGVYLLAMAINQAGSTDSDKVVAALENLQGTFNGALTTYNKPWSKSDHEYNKVSDLLKMGVNKGGKVYRMQ